MAQKCYSLQIIKVNNNKFKVGKREMTYLELIEWFKEKMIEEA